MNVLGVGHALVDAFAFVSEDVPSVLGLHSGSFNQVPDYRMRAILLTLRNRMLMAGGSSANVVKLTAQLGLPSFFVSKCGNDEPGKLFESELLQAGVQVHLLKTDIPTGTCVTFLTPMRSRTVATFRSAAADLPPELVSDAQLTMADFVVVEGYLLDEPEFLRSLLERCRRQAKTVVFDTSDSALIGRHREQLLSYLERGFIQYLFAQETEAASLTETDAAGAFDRLAPLVTAFILKRGQRGCLIRSEGKLIAIPAVGPVSVDSTGAGDALEAGFLWGLSHGLSVPDACRCGAIVAGCIIQHPGTRISQETMDNVRTALEELRPQAGFQPGLE